MCVFIWAVRLALRTVSALETVRNGLKDGYRFPTTPFFIRLERISCCQSSWPGFPVKRILLSSEFPEAHPLPPQGPFTVLLRSTWSCLQDCSQGL